jgi:hypothetical protein
MPAGDMAERVVRSQARLRAALEEWEAVDLAACESARQELQEAVEEMKCACSGAAAVSPMRVPALIVKLRSIRRDALRLAKLIDAAQAYYRGLALRAGAEPIGGSGEQIPSGKWGQA